VDCLSTKRRQATKLPHLIEEQAQNSHKGKMVGTGYNWTQFPDLLFKLVQTQKIVKMWPSEVPKWLNKTIKFNKQTVQLHVAMTERPF
jgi:hypothetical protein